MYSLSCILAVKSDICFCPAEKLKAERHLKGNDGKQSFQKTCSNGDQMQIIFRMQIYFLQHLSLKNIDSWGLVYSLSNEQVMALRLLFWERFFRLHSQNAKRLCRKAVNSQMDQTSDGF